jgi:hypothetical protein
MSKRQIPRLAALAIVLLVIAGVGLRGEIAGGASTSTPGAGSSIQWPCQLPAAWSGAAGGHGMMGGNSQGGMMNGYAMMGDWGAWGGMMGSMGMMAPYAASQKPLSDTELRQRLTDYAATCTADLRVEGIIPFANDYYARLVAADGTGVGEILADRFTGVVYPEPGPTMMWNGRYGYAGRTAANTTGDEAAATNAADSFLSTYLPGATVLEGMGFPGYYTFTFGQGSAAGLMSVDVSTGAVWAHVWLGPILSAAS